MEIKEILKMDKEIIDIDTLDAVWESEEVESVEDCGFSGYNIGYTWYNVILKDGQEIDVYI